MWMASVGAAAAKSFFQNIFTEFFKTLLGFLISRKIDKEKTVSSLAENFTEQKILAFAETVRKGSRKFLWSGIICRILFGAVNHIFLIKNAL